PAGARAPPLRVQGHRMGFSPGRRPRRAAGRAHPTRHSEVPRTLADRSDRGIPLPQTLLTSALRAAALNASRARDPASPAPPGLTDPLLDAVLASDDYPLWDAGRGIRHLPIVL